MQLAKALRIHPATSQLIAFVGAGGKTAAMARLGRELSSTMDVILTTTTRLGVGQEEIADSHLIVADVADLEAVPVELKDSNLLLVSGPMSPDNKKWEGLSLDMVEALRTTVAHSPTSILVEAEGARQRSIKVPASHEPMIPAGADLILIIAGLDSLGQPIDERSTHRPDDLLKLLSLQSGTILLEDHVIRLLSDPTGGLKGVPENSRVVILLNKAHKPEQLDQGRVIGKALLKSERIRSVLLTTLIDHDPVRRVISRIGGIVLAAGGSTRLPVPKQIAQWRGKPLLLHSIETAKKGGLDPVVVVLGHKADEIQACLDDPELEIILNRDWKHGQSTSVRAGLEMLDPRVDGVVFLLADMPLITAKLIQALLSEHERNFYPLTAPRAGGRRANPVLFDRRTFADLMNLKGDHGGRVLFEKYEVAWVEWDEQILLDVDTPSDLEYLKGIQ